MFGMMCVKQLLEIVVSLSSAPSAGYHYPRVRAPNLTLAIRSDTGGVDTDREPYLGVAVFHQTALVTTCVHSESI